MDTTDRNTRLITRRYDVTGYEIWRTVRQAILRRLVPTKTAKFGGGPGAGWLIRFLFWHRFGRGVCRVVVRFETQCLLCYGWLAALKRNARTSS